MSATVCYDRRDWPLLWELGRLLEGNELSARERQAINDQLAALLAEVRRRTGRRAAA